MADAKITELPAATLPLAGTELVPIVQGAETRRVAASAITRSPQIDVYTTPGTATWTKPAGAVAVHVRVIGGGGGGGSGRRGAASTARSGGGGATGGGMSEYTFEASALGATETVTVGAGGTGGAARTTNDTAGANGTAGGASIFGTRIRAWGGQEGAGGNTASVGSLFNEPGFAMYPGGNGGFTDPTSVGNGGLGGGHFSPLQNGITGATGGGAGGSLVSNNAEGTGGAGGWHAYFGGAAILNAAGGAVGANGSTQTDPPASLRLPGAGGGGGGSSLTAAGGNGGNGSTYGGGGGGGGASVNGNNSGAGGNGADGCVVVITHF